MDVWRVYCGQPSCAGQWQNFKKDPSADCFFLYDLADHFSDPWIVQPENVNVLFQVVGLKFYREGIFYALHIGLNILNMLLSFAVFVLSTKPSEFVDELEKRGFSPRFGYIVTSVFQIIPQMMGTMNTIIDAQRSRGLETEGNLRTRGKAFLPLISPVVMSSLINTRERAIALEVRGFGAGKKKPG